MVVHQLFQLNLSTGDLVSEYGYNRKSDRSPRTVAITCSYYGFYTKVDGQTNRYTRYGIVDDRSAMGLMHSYGFSTKNYKLLLLNKIKRIISL
jgi:hypothetical protein